LSTLPLGLVLVHDHVEESDAADLKDAPDPQEAHELINFLIRPDIAAKNTNYVSYANGDVPGDLIDKAIRDDPTVYPDAATMAKLYTITAHDQKTQRLINRLWTRIKTGK